MKQTPLTAKHRALGAKMIDYAGFEMPVQYTGLVEEHLTVRSAVGIFDLTHMGELELTGPGALDTVNRLCSNDASALEVGEIQYTCITNEQGGIIDDILVYRTKQGFLLVVNAANTAKDYAWIKQHLQPDTELVDRSGELTLIAIQGPKSAPLVEEVLGLSTAELKNYTFVEPEYKGVPVLLSRTGYTGEDGFELYFPNQFAEEMWDAFLTHGEKYGVKPVGLGARDTLRLEARMPLYGNDINEETTPLEAGLGRFVKLHKEFTGSAVLKQQKEEGVQRKLVAFTMLDKGIPRQGYPLLSLEGEEIGAVTSGTHSPSLDHPIGMGYVRVDLAVPGTEIQVQIRKRLARAKIIKGRFLP
ncbi:MAG TPA: glycine cleavage system aminomethyltransferase GcvT [Limnochordia bacterium]|nr:glycine cleavage system aminomethyltransferase GcvT [Limnochordia bacterium]